MLKEPSKEQVACHQPKPILLDNGEMDVPYKWAVSLFFILEDFYVLYAENVLSKILI